MQKGTDYLHKNVNKNRRLSGRKLDKAGPRPGAGGAEKYKAFIAGQKTSPESPSPPRKKESWDVATFSYLQSCEWLQKVSSSYVTYEILKDGGKNVKII